MMMPILIMLMPPLITCEHFAELETSELKHVDRGLGYTVDVLSIINNKSACQLFSLKWRRRQAGNQRFLAIREERRGSLLS